MHPLSLDPLEEFPCPSCGLSLNASQAEPFSKFVCTQCGQEGTVPGLFGAFHLLGQQGESVTGTLQNAYDTKLGRYVSLKILDAVYSNNNELVAAFKKEAMAAASLNSLYVLKVYEFGVHNRQPYMVLEHIEGEFLNQVLDRGPLDQGKAVRLAQGIAQGLEELQAQGIIHGEVSPRNILLHKDGKPRFSDFGLARINGQQDTTSQNWSSPYYMPPERILGDPEDFRSDFYSLGTTLYYMVTGSLPFFDLDEEKLRKQKCQEPAPDPLESNPDLNPALVDLLNTLLQRNPDDRPGSYEEIIHQLNQVAGHSAETEITEAPPSPPTPSPTRKPNNRREALTWFIFLSLAGALIAILFSTITENEAPPPPPVPTPTPVYQEAAPPPTPEPLPSATPTPLPTATPTPVPTPTPTPVPITPESLSRDQLLLNAPAGPTGKKVSEWRQDSRVIFQQAQPARQPVIDNAAPRKENVLSFGGQNMVSTLMPHLQEEFTLILAAFEENRPSRHPQLLIGVHPASTGWSPFALLTEPALPGGFTLRTDRGSASLTLPRSQRGKPFVFAFRRMAGRQEAILNGRRVNLPSLQTRAPEASPSQLMSLQIGGTSDPKYDFHGWMGSVYLADRALTDKELSVMIREFETRYLLTP